MSISKRTLWAAACICLVCGSPLFAITITVSKTLPAAYKTIQEAVDASVAGDTVKILDAATYPEQVTINTRHSGITLTSANPTSPNKPKIVWQDKVNEGPKTCAEAQVDSMITFDQNGALRLMRVRNVVVNGITVDGGGVMPFGSTGPVWPPTGGVKSQCMYPLLHGNTAILLWISGSIIVKNCEAQNAYFGVYFKDRNEGGIFANANPGDNAPWNVVPLSAFGQTGNHILEYSRIHNNSWGIFVESAWDLGNTVRYNLIYENHHPTAAIATLVKGINSEGNNQPGGAFYFKDDELCPFSIYNNTFWHNYLIFCGAWQPGYQHLVFNNIFAKPFIYWRDVPVFPNSYMEISPVLPNRITNCVYSCQAQPPSPGYIMIMNGFPQVQGQNNLPPPQGSLLQSAQANQAFPAAANNRWLEMDSSFFISIDPASPNFLEPNWTDPNVEKYIKNQGWQKSGVKNLDGTWADLGAIPSSGGLPAYEASITPIMPVQLAGSTAILTFSLNENVGKILNPTITFFRYVSNVQFVKDAWANGAAALVIKAGDINNIPVPATPVKVGVNTFSITLPVAQTTPYAFFELIIEGTGADGKAYTSSTGFLPYRKLEYKFKIQVFALSDINYANPLTQVIAGDSVILRMTPQKADGTLFTNRVDYVSNWLQSGAKLRVPAYGPGDTTVTYTNGVTGPTNKQVMFTKVPTINGGIEFVYASGVWRSTTDTTQTRAFPGVSDAIRIIAGTPAKVVFQDPPSKRFGIPPPKLNPGQTYNGDLFVYDVFDNKASAPATITLTSLTPAVASFDTNTIITDSTGTGRFGINSTNTAVENTPVIVQALLAATNNLDTAFMTVGQRLEHLFIFYSDTSLYNPATRLEGQVGDRLPVTIIATKAGIPTLDSIAAGRTDTFTVTGTGLEFYNSATATAQAANFALVKGRATVWITNNLHIDSINNACIVATPATAAIGKSSQRCNIYFHRSPVTIDSAFYYSRTGFGMVDSIDIFYRQKLALVPDSIALFWPGADADKRVVLSSQMKLAPDSVHVSIVLALPFTPGITAATGAVKQGISYNRPNNNPGVPGAATTFAIKDRVGPLIMSAQLIERLVPGTTDTLYVTFSEPMLASSLTGGTLILIKPGVVPSSLVISANFPAGTNRFKLVVTATTQAFAPDSGDSVRIDPAGPIADALGNKAHLLNRPVVITLKPIPAHILQAWYLDKNADGVVDAVDVIFDKAVTLSDVVMSLDWGNSNRADSIPATLLSYVGTGNLGMEINVRGIFKGLTADTIKTSGLMNATVGFRALPTDPTSGAGVVDSAAPVIATAKYFPSPSPTGLDTLTVEFSEPVATLTSTKPFNFYSKGSGKPYTITLDITSFPSNGNLHSFLVNQTNISGVDFPVSGDSVWIDPAAGVADAATVVQKNAANRRAILFVAPIDYNPHMMIVKNPFVIGLPVTDGAVSGMGTIIKIPPPLRMTDNTSLLNSGTISIYDVLGNTVINEVPLTKLNNNWLYYNWDGRNLHSRYVGSGTYIGVVTVTQNSGKVTTSKKTIGVKR